MDALREAIRDAHEATRDLRTERRRLAEEIAAATRMLQQATADMRHLDQVSRDARAIAVDHFQGDLAAVAAGACKGFGDWAEEQVQAMRKELNDALGQVLGLVPKSVTWDEFTNQICHLVTDLVIKTLDRGLREPREIGTPPRDLRDTLQVVRVERALAEAMQNATVTHGPGSVTYDFSASPVDLG